MVILTIKKLRPPFFTFLGGESDVGVFLCERIVLSAVVDKGDLNRKRILMYGDLHHGVAFSLFVSIAGDVAEQFKESVSNSVLNLLLYPREHLLQNDLERCAL